MFTLNAHAATPSGLCLAPTAVERSGPDPRDVAQSVVPLLPPPGDMP
ncbi:hypothetical protein [Streptomyces geranii]|nr:hypothetical protein [Streptomyces geranii]